MVCPRCGQSTSSVSAPRCLSCGEAFVSSAIATVVIPADTTGLPPGATFGATVAHAVGATLGATIPDGQAASSPPAEPQSAQAGGQLRVGQSFGPRYHVIKLLGAGGMGAVYQTWDEELGVAVALKVIRTDPRRSRISAEAEKRFKQELLLARQVTHKNVVRIHDLGEIDGIKYITMPYVQGDDLASTVRGGFKLPVTLTLKIARQVAAGLEAAHDAGVVHRDLKPANVMITLSQEDVHAQIMDF